MARMITRLVAGSSALALAVLVPVTSAVAQDTAPVITNTETVNVTLDATGEVEVARLYDQIAIQGTGDVAYQNPVSTEGLRNLDNFGGFDVQDGAIVEETSVDGQLRRRSLSDFSQDLPVTVQVTYTLDGAEIAPSDLVGKSGELEVTYRVENMTGATEEVEFVTYSGETLTKDEMVYDPLAGSLTMTLPSTFTDVTSESGAVIAGDGRGGTKMSFSVTLIPPLGDPVAEVSYRAKVENATIPPANLTFIPVVISNNPTVTGAKESFEGGAQTGRDLAAGATEIDANVLKLADGAGGLLKGLILLRGGATQLSRGLVDDAAPGADELSAGAETLSDGLSELQGNIPALVAGIALLNAGGGDLSDGLAELNSKIPALLDGVDKLAAGSKDLQKGLKQLQSNIPALTEGVAALNAGSADVAGGLNSLEGLVDAQFGPGLADLAGTLAKAPDDIQAAINQIAPTCKGDPVCLGTVDSVSKGVKADVQKAADGAGALNEGWTKQIRPGIAKISGGADQVSAGLAQLEAQVGPLAEGVDALTAGAEALAAGLDQLQTSLSPLADGIDKLEAGAQKLEDGLAQLQENSGPLADGVDQLADGGVQLKDGAGLLAVGLAAAADGSGELASGLKEAAAGAPALPEGAKRLSKEGTSQLIEAGKETAENFATQVATLVASAKRTEDGGLPYGPPEDALRFAAYSYDISGADGAQAQNMGRLIAALLVGAGAVGGAAWFAQRRRSTA